MSLLRDIEPIKTKEFYMKNSKLIMKTLKLNYPLGLLQENGGF